MIEPVEVSPMVLPVAEMPAPTKLAILNKPVPELLHEIFFTVLFCKYIRFAFEGPGFAANANELCETADRDGAGVIAWNATGYHWATKETKGCFKIAFGNAGRYDSCGLADFLFSPNNLAYSQASFMYQRDTVLDILSWCEDNLAT